MLICSSAADTLAVAFKSTTAIPSWWLTADTRPGHPPDGTAADLTMMRGTKTLSR